MQCPKCKTHQSPKETCGWCGAPLAAKRRECVLICGSRDWSQTVLLKERLASLDRTRTTIIHGGARGADTHAANLADQLGIPAQSYPPDYASFGKDAPHVRNDEMLKHADRVLAFWDGKSPGTKSVIDKARKLGIPTEVIGV